MGLAAELSYAYRPPNAFHRSMQSFGASRPGAWLFAKSLVPMDRALTALSKGRATVPSMMARLPVLVLTSTGRKTGQPRETYLIAVPYRDTLALLGTNFGQPHTPAWVYNLEADPRAAVSYNGVRREVVAGPATQDERDQILAASKTVYGGYTKYQQRITGRQLRIFVLELARPAGEPAGEPRSDADDT